MTAARQRQLLGQVEHVVRHPRLLLGGRLGGSDVHPPVHLHRVRRDDLRALPLRPSVLLLDEVSANLDDSNTECVEQLLHQYQQDSGAVILWVSHDPEQRDRIARRQARIADGVVTEASP